MTTGMLTLYQELAQQLKLKYLQNRHNPSSLDTVCKAVQLKDSKGSTCGATKIHPKVSLLESLYKIRAEVRLSV